MNDKSKSSSNNLSVTRAASANERHKSVHQVVFYDHVHYVTDRAM